MKETLEDRYSLQMAKRARFKSYYILEDGRVYNCKTRKFLKGQIRGGYHRVTLSYDGKSHYKTTHKLMMELLGPNKPSPKHEVNHIDGDKLNNNMSNLQWVTRSENISHAYETGLIPDRRGYKNSNARLGKKDREIIIQKKMDGFKTKHLAERFGVNVSTINRIVKKGY